MKRTATVLTLFLLLALLTVSAAADGIWYCPVCGRQNDLSFCPADGTAKPSDLDGAPGLENAPVSLMSLTPYYVGKNKIELFTKPIKDIMGNQYSGGGIRGYMEPNTDDCFAIWDIGRSYSLLTATCIVRERDKGSRHEASFRIYGDNVLLYEQKGITGMTKPFQFSVDLTGVTDLKIELFGNGNMSTSGINAVLVELELYR